MRRKHLLLLLLMAAPSGMTQAEELTTEYFLPTVDSSEEGHWPCLFYELNYNSDLTPAERAKWYATDEDESFWREGLGPFSIDQNKFLVTQWQSTVHPILIRRHFTLSAEDLQKIEAGTVTMTYSYDENPKFWLNGTRLVTATGWNDDNYASFRFTTTRKKLLVEGDNVLCVSLQQGSGGGHIDYGLYVTYDPTTTATPLLTASPEAEDITFDLQGRRLADANTPQDKLPRGIYIRNGKKTIRR